MDNNEIQLKIIDEIIENCSEYLNFNEIIYGVEELSYCIMGHIALYLSGEFASENNNIYDNFTENIKQKALDKINEIFDKYIDSQNNNCPIKDLFLAGFFECLNFEEKEYLRKTAKNNTRNAIIAFYVYDIIIEYWPRDSKNMPIALKINEQNYNPIEEIIKNKINKNDKIVLENILSILSKKGLKMNKDNIKGIVKRICNI